MRVSPRRKSAGPLTRLRPCAQAPPSKRLRRLWLRETGKKGEPRNHFRRPLESGICSSFPEQRLVIESTESLLHLIPSPLHMLANHTYRFIRSVTRLTPIKLCCLNAQVNTTHKSKGLVVAGFVVKGCSSRRH